MTEIVHCVLLIPYQKEELVLALLVVLVRLPTSTYVSCVQKIHSHPTEDLADHVNQVPTHVQVPTNVSSVDVVNKSTRHSTDVRFVNQDFSLLMIQVHV